MYVSDVFSMQETSIKDTIDRDVQKVTSLAEAKNYVSGELKAYMDKLQKNNSQLLQISNGLIQNGWSNLLSPSKENRSKQVMIPRSLFPMIDQSGRDLMPRQISSLSPDQRKQVIESQVVQVLATFQAATVGSLMGGDNLLTNELIKRMSRNRLEVSSDALMVMPELKSAMKELLIDPSYQVLLNPIADNAVSSLNIDQALHGMTLEPVSKSEIDKAFVAIMLPAPVSDDMLEVGASIMTLVMSGDAKVAPVKCNQMLQEVEKNLYFRNGDLNDVQVLSKLDFLNKISIFLTSHFATEMEFALSEIGKTSEDLKNPDFDTNQLMLYKDVKREAYDILKNRLVIINMLRALENTRSVLLTKLTDNFDTLTIGSKILTVQATIAAQQSQLLWITPNLLGGLAAVGQDVSSTSLTKVSGKLIKNVLGLEKELSLRDNQKEETVSVLAMLGSILQMLIIQQQRLYIGQQQGSDITHGRPIRSILSQLSEKEVQALEDIGRTLKSNSDLLTDSSDKEKIDHAITQQVDTLTKDKEAISQPSGPLTKEFMDEVAKNAASWLGKLSHKADMIRFDDVAKVVADKKYDKNQLLYINGFLQAMTL
jgi:hypothetical protein